MRRRPFLSVTKEPRELYKAELESGHRLAKGLQGLGNEEPLAWRSVPEEPLPVARQAIPEGM